MKNEYIKIFIDRLANEGEFSQTGQLPADLLELSDSEAHASSINYNLSAYIADDHLIINYDADCSVSIPCKICNEPSPFEIKCPKQTLLEPLQEIKKGSFEGSLAIRDSILLNIPPYHECGGNCPERNELKKYLKKDSQEAETYHPFQGL